MMARKGSQYTDDQLAEMYRRYASLKGWSTRDDIVRDKVELWRGMSIGLVGFAIEFHETGKDHCKHTGRNAEEEGLA